MPRSNPNVAGALLALAAFAVFASHDAIIKHLAATYSPIQIVFCIALFSFPILLAKLALDRETGTLIPRHPRLVMLRGAMTSLAALMAFHAFAVLPMAQVYVILFSTPLLVSVLAVPILGERVGPRRLIAVIVGMIGVLVVLRPGTAALSSGHLAALAAATMSSLSAVITRKIGRVERSVVMILHAMGANFLLMGLAMPFVYLPMPGPDLVLMMTIAAMSFLAMQLLILAYRRAEAAMVAPMQYSQILWAILFGALFFHESPDHMTLVGGGIVIASGLYIVLREARLKAATPPPPGTDR